MAFLDESYVSRRIVEEVSGLDMRCRDWGCELAGGFFYDISYFGLHVIVLETVNARVRVSQLCESPPELWTWEMCDRSLEKALPLRQPPVACLDEV
mmetsp:Transcript_17709/g.71469  ORF Transcript_17709/g.71469 Transcript_17709/m.71469 type:complete len:96 (-) Transcript_17709:2189-2476(-)